MKNYLVILLLLISLVSGAQQIKRVRITDIEKTIAESKTPLILSFWATYCKPCLQEIPYFQESVHAHKADSIKLILVSLDLREAYPAQIKMFAAKRKFTVPIQWLDESNADYFCPRVDSSWS